LHKLSTMFEMRIDKYLWCLRLFKTRTLASDFCKKGKVFINNDKTKSSKIIKENDHIKIVKAAITYEYIVKKIPKSRLNAKLITEYMEDITSSEELNKLKNIKEYQVTYNRPKGIGRPTKKERRELDNLLN